jgi:hypothetical protein
VDDFPIKLTFSKELVGKWRVFTPQKQQKDARTAEGYKSSGESRLFYW